MLVECLAEQALEAEIEHRKHRMIEAFARGETSTARFHWRIMRDLIALRSPERVVRMERERGLR